MNQSDDTRYGELDKVKLRLTRNVNWRSHPPDCTPDPNGEWVVSAVLGSVLVLTQGMAVISIPASDVVISKKYDPNWIDDQLDRIIGNRTDG